MQKDYFSQQRALTVFMIKMFLDEPAQIFEDRTKVFFHTVSFSNNWLI